MANLTTILRTIASLNTLNLYCGLFVLDDGDIYVCGWNKNGQLGIASTDVDATMFRPLPNLPSKMIKVSCGWSHTLALSERGEVFVWGSNTYGQLGEPRVLKQSSSPVQLSSEVS